MTKRIRQRYLAAALSLRQPMPVPRWIWLPIMPDWIQLEKGSWQKQGQRST
jgi:hypothetical protein